VHEDPEVMREKTARMRETLARLEARLAYGETEREVWEAVVPDPPPDPNESYPEKLRRWSNRELEDDAARLQAELRDAWMARVRRGTGRDMADPANWWSPERQASDEPRGSRRRAIPQAVKVAVAARDNGRCQCTARGCHGYSGMCGSTEEPHFDHIIPWSRGGVDLETSRSRLTMK